MKYHTNLSTNNKLSLLNAAALILVIAMFAYYYDSSWQMYRGLTASMLFSIFILTYYYCKTKTLMISLLINAIISNISFLTIVNISSAPSYFQCDCVSVISVVLLFSFSLIIVRLSIKLGIFLYSSFIIFYLIFAILLFNIGIKVPFIEYIFLVMLVLFSLYFYIEQNKKFKKSDKQKYGNIKLFLCVYFLILLVIVFNELYVKVPIFQPIHIEKIITGVYSLLFFLSAFLVELDFEKLILDDGTAYQYNKGEDAMEFIKKNTISQMRGVANTLKYSNVPTRGTLPLLSSLTDLPMTTAPTTTGDFSTISIDDTVITKTGVKRRNFDIKRTCVDMEDIEESKKNSPRILRINDEFDSDTTGTAGNHLALNRPVVMEGESMSTFLPFTKSESIPQKSSTNTDPSNTELSAKKKGIRAKTEYVTPNLILGYERAQNLAPLLCVAKEEDLSLLTEELREEEQGAVEKYIDKNEEKINEAENQIYKKSKCPKNEKCPKCDEPGEKIKSMKFVKKE